MKCIVEALVIWQLACKVINRQDTERYMRFHHYFTLLIQSTAVSYY
jgi:hypothetical protein